MRLGELLSASRQWLREHPGYAEGADGLNLFSSGAAWMQKHLLQMDGKQPLPLGNARRFTKYGIVKYGISLLVFIISVVLFIEHCIYLLPLSVVVFYLVEVQFLFLFPLLIDDLQHPILKSVKATYKVGIFRALFITIGIGIFMLAGLLRLNDPLYNWHVGCVAVLIWYRDEVRGRL